MSANGPPSLEILEAGTGHGALTLYLSRAIHAANQNIPQSDTLRDSTRNKDNGPNFVNDDLAGSIIKGEMDSQTSPYEHEKDQREAVIHSIDVVGKRTESAAKMIRGFRKGMYRDAIEFHVGDVSEWIDGQFTQRKSKESPFLSHIILDMPSTDRHIEKAASALKINGSLIAFNPSITQIVSIVDVVKRQYLPLQLDRVVELGQGMTGGREWDIRAVNPRASIKARDGGSSMPLESGGVASAPRSSDDQYSGGDSAEIERQHHGEAESPSVEDKNWEMVCRPKVGERLVGGGFLGVAMPSTPFHPHLETGRIRKHVVVASLLRRVSIPVFLPHWYVLT